MWRAFLVIFGKLLTHLPGYELWGPRHFNDFGRIHPWLPGNESGGHFFIFITDPLFPFGEAVWRHPSCVYIYLPKWNVCFILSDSSPTPDRQNYISGWKLSCQQSNAITNRSSWKTSNREILLALDVPDYIIISKHSVASRIGGCVWYLCYAGPLSTVCSVYHANFIL